MKLIHGDCLEAMRLMDESCVDSVVTDPPAGISFMNKGWDDDKGGRDQWVAWLTEVMKEALRVLKPGGHALVWAIPRTSHWTGKALEDAGFEVRDVITHLFGTGFPKSLDISKAIDKAAGAEREVVATVKKTPSAHSENMHEGYRRPWAENHPKTMDITAPSTDAAKQWQGFGTALKPAAEFWFLVRKPLSERTVAANVLKWGTGGINIDGCRIPGAIPVVPQPRLNAGDIYGLEKGGKGRVEGMVSRSEGRFPANLILSEGTDKVLDESAGQSVAKFFYVAKASASEKNANLDTEETTVDDGRNIPIDNPFQRGKTARKNTHPTVKAIKLMEYLVKLVTPPGGTVLDMFMGSGSTGVAAQSLGFSFIGIEREAEYLAIAAARINKF